MKKVLLLLAILILLLIGGFVYYHYQQEIFSQISQIFKIQNKNPEPDFVKLIDDAKNVNGTFVYEANKVYKSVQKSGDNMEISVGLKNSNKWWNTPAAYFPTRDLLPYIISGRPADDNGLANQQDAGDANLDSPVILDTDNIQKLTRQYLGTEKVNGFTCYHYLIDLTQDYLKNVNFSHFVSIFFTPQQINSSGQIEAANYQLDICLDAQRGFIVERTYKKTSNANLGATGNNFSHILLVSYNSKPPSFALPKFMVKNNP